MATDWTKQAEDMVKTWTGSQQKMWESWLEILRSMGTAPSGDMWEKTVGTWRDSVKSALEAQVTWTKFWADSITSSSGSSKQMAEWSNQTLEMTKRWTETQNQLWDAWFDAIKKSDPAMLGKNWTPEEMQKAMQSWQDAARRMMESQMEMVRLWTNPEKGQ